MGGRRARGLVRLALCLAPHIILSVCLPGGGCGGAKRKWRGDRRRACFALTQGDGISSRTPHCSPPERVCFEIDSCQMHAASSFSENGDFQSFAAYAVGLGGSCSSDLEGRRSGRVSVPFCNPARQRDNPRATPPSRPTLHMGNHM